MATPPNQKADERPISFVLHNMATGSPPREKQLIIRPEDLTRTEPSRLMTHQTLGGAWADNFGPGIPTVQISGTTGWRTSALNGLGEFIDLHETIYTAWHTERALASEAGLDPNKVKLIFSDILDEFTWVVAPQTFVLRRNKSRPLLSQYQISMTWLSDDVAETMGDLNAIKLSDAETAAAAMESLNASLVTIDSFTSTMSTDLDGFLGPAKFVFQELVRLTGSVLHYVQSVLTSANGFVSKTAADLLNIAGNMSRAVANVINTYQSIVTFPQRVNAKMGHVAAAFNNVVCLIKNAFKKRTFLENYDSLYGSSNCSSTAGGKPVSIYATENPFPVYFPLESSGVVVSQSASASITRLANADPVLYPASSTALAADMTAINSGVRLTA